MKRIILIILMISLLTSLCFSIPKPKNDKVGAVIGRFYIDMDKDRNTLKKGKYYKVKLFFYNKNTGKKYTITANKDGYYFLPNLQEGNYVLYSFKYSITVEYITYYFGGPIYDNGKNFRIVQHKINAFKTIIAKHEILPRTDKENRASPELSFSPMNVRFIEEENLSELKTYFSNLDKRNLWTDFEFDYEGIKK